MKHTALSLGLCGTGLLLFMVSATGAEPDGHAFFESRIRPLLLKHCFECHSAEKTKGGLRLDYRGGFKKGGDSGDLLDAERPENSLFLQTIRHEIDDQKMPKGEAKLSDGAIADLTRWIRMGLPGLPEKPLTAKEASQQEWAHKLAERRTHWAWQPVAAPTVPEVTHPTWAKHAVDRFLLAQMTPKGLAPAKPAPRWILIRRLKIALLGLPPTPEEVDSFVNDTTPHAYERLVDRFLQDPAFGENWAAYWLDLMRYGETGGYVRDYPIPEAWRYRDYVIRAFNQDLPYDRFVKEHLAGDLLPPRINQDLKINEAPIGTACMRLMEVSSTSTDVALEEAQIIENQIDTLGKAFQGLTIACARCHDHKFDAISTRDYYGIFGVLAGSRQSQTVIDTPEVRQKGVAELRQVKQELKDSLEKIWKEDIEKHATQLEKLLANGSSVKPEAQSLWSKLLSQKQVPIEDPAYPAWKAYQAPDPAQRAEAQRRAETEIAETARKRAETNRTQFKVVTDFTKGTAGWSASGVLPETLYQRNSDFALRPSGGELVERFIAPGVASDRITRKHGAILRSADFKLNAQFVSVRVAGGDAAHFRMIQHNFQQMENIAQQHKVGHFESRFPTWVTIRVGHQASWQGLRSYWELLTKDDVAHFRRSDAGDKFFKLTERDHTGRSWFQVEQIVEHDQPKPPEDELLAGLLLLPGDASDQPQSNWEAHWKKVCNQAIEHWMQNKASAGEVTLLNWLLAQGFLRNTLEAFPAPIKNLVAEYRNLEESLPKFQRAPTLVQEGPGFDASVQRRGSPDSPGDAAERRYLEVLGGTKGYDRETSPRLGLALDLASPKNPLTSRVMVNRLWRWLFGQGIVSSVDNFGVMGDKPTHPELLDHLATHFIEHGWSFKQLVRYLVTTQAYQTESVASPEAQKIDTANRYLSHMPLQRLRAEAVRDSLLAVSGSLNPLMYGYTGPTNRLKNDGPNQRRGVYQHIKREAQDHLMVMFDAPEPSRTQGSRESSNVPGQSLLLLNNPFVHAQASAWATRDLAQFKNLSLEQRLERLFREALGRKPAPGEIQILVEFFQDQAEAYQLPYDAQSKDNRLWTDLCHVLLNAKEFLYLQ